MTRRAILHIGMHKTGSSSIQETLARVPLQGAVYLLPETPNHSAVLSQAFEVDKDLRKLFHPMTPEVSQPARATLRRKLTAACAAPDVDTVIISGERLSVMSSDALQLLKADLDTLFDEIVVIGYVRPVAGMMASSFQQVLKHGHAQFEAGLKTPRYRFRFEKFDDIFGRDQVWLYLFDRKLLKDGDAVVDFAARIGRTIDVADVVQTNESLSLEGTALLYAHRKFVAGESAKRTNFVARDAQLIELCRTLGHGKFAFNGAALEAGIQKNAADFRWVCDRIGASFDDFCKVNGGGVGSEDDLFAVLERPETQAELRKALGLSPDGPGLPARDLAFALEQLRDA